jgi:hypothetical protein
MNAYPVTEFLRLSPIEIYTGLSGEIPVYFEDNVTRLIDSKNILLSHYVWRIYVKHNILITSKDIISEFYKDGYYVKGSHIEFLSMFLKKVLKKIKHSIYVKQELFSIYSDIYRVVNDIQNELIPLLTKHMFSATLIDMIEIQQDERILDAMENFQYNPTNSNLNFVYDQIDVVMLDEINRYNGAALGRKAGFVSKNQQNQVFGSIGYVTDLNGKLFNVPIVSSFMKGLSKNYEYVLSYMHKLKSDTLQQTGVQKPQHAGRITQILNILVKKIVFGNCGNDKFVPFGEVTKNDLSQLAGKWYKDKDGVVKAISESDTHLIGETVYIRTIHDCRVKEKGVVCSACFGDTYYNIPYKTNPGHASSARIASVSAQTMLSFKHLSKSAVASDAKLDPITAEYFELNDDEITFNDSKFDFVKAFIEVTGKSFDSYNLIAGADLSLVTPEDLSAIKGVFLKFVQEDGSEYKTSELIIKSDERMGYFTIEFLEHINTHMTTHVSKNNRITIDITNWDMGKPIMKLDKVEFSYEKFADNFKSFLESQSINREFNKYSLTEHIYKVISEKFTSIKYSDVEIFVKAFVIKDYDEGDFRMGDYLDEQVSDLPAVSINRVATALGRENMRTLLTNPSTFKKNTETHVFDVLFTTQK